MLIFYLLAKLSYNLQVGMVTKILIIIFTPCPWVSAHMTNFSTTPPNIASSPVVYVGVVHLLLDLAACIGAVARLGM